MVRTTIKYPSIYFQSKISKIADIPNIRRQVKSLFVSEDCILCFANQIIQT